MSAPPPHYQNQPPYGYQQQPPPYGYPQQQQQQPHQPPPYGYQQQPQPPRGPQQPPPGGALRALKAAVVVIAIVAGVGYYVWDYNTSPTGGKAKAEASQSAQVKEDMTHNPEVGDCVKVKDPEGNPLPTVVDCGSAEAEYKTGEKILGPYKECGSKYDYGIQHRNNRGADYTLCFTKV
ncbi:MAG: LppU/SCO3897 family protein [Streptomyces sp.]|uniref:LppU/SCO3897 family protein n=1 Tax=Streptomyces sp. TaxID=1931 RepID=UPI003D6A453D